jgi:hypothetical protein
MAAIRLRRESRALVHLAHTALAEGSKNFIYGRVLQQEKRHLIVRAEFTDQGSNQLLYYGVSGSYLHPGAWKPSDNTN